MDVTADNIIRIKVLNRTSRARKRRERSCFGIGKGRLESRIARKARRSSEVSKSRTTQLKFASKKEKDETIDPRALK